MTVVPFAAILFVCTSPVVKGQSDSSRYDGLFSALRGPHFLGVRRDIIKQGCKLIPSLIEYAEHRPDEESYLYENVLMYFPGTCLTGRLDALKSPDRGATLLMLRSIRTGAGVRKVALETLKHERSSTKRHTLRQTALQLSWTTADELRAAVETARDSSDLEVSRTAKDVLWILDTTPVDRLRAKPRKREIRSQVGHRL